MEEHVRNVYLFEAVKQCRFGLNAHAALLNVLARLFESPVVVDLDARNTLQNEVFRSLHSLLTHASNVSRLLWPALPRRTKGESNSHYAARVARHRRSTRASVLRSAAGLAQEHPLKSREIRDHLEHFDERLDHWAETSVGRSIAQDVIGGPNTITGLADEDMMRWYDPATHSLWFQGSQYEIRAITDGLMDVYDACTGVLASSGFVASLKLIEWNPKRPESAS
jgi:hypothetical protein